MTSRSRILVAGHGPVGATGYSRVMHRLAHSFIEAGYPVAVVNLGHAGGSHEVRYRIFAPQEGRPLESVAAACREFVPDVLLTIGDPWMFDFLPALRERRSAIWIAYFHVDGRPLPLQWGPWIAAADVPVVFCRFTQDLVAEATGKPPVLVNRGVNTKRFRPRDSSRAKTVANVAGHFVVGAAARNQLGENLPALLRAFAKFSCGKNDALLYLHAQVLGQWDLKALSHQLGISAKTRVTADLRGGCDVPDETLATIYNAMDVFVVPTMGEGLGLPIIEAQACGVPALVTDFSAYPELVPDPIQRLRVKDTLVMHRNLEQAIVDCDDIAGKLEYFYRERAELESLGRRCHKFAQQFDWEIACRQFVDLIDRLPAKAVASGQCPVVASDVGQGGQEQSALLAETPYAPNEKKRAVAAEAPRNSDGPEVSYENAEVAAAPVEEWSPVAGDIRPIVNVILWIHRGGQVAGAQLLRDLLRRNGIASRLIITSRNTPGPEYRADCNLFSSEMSPLWLPQARVNVLLPNQEQDVRQSFGRMHATRFDETRDQLCYLRLLDKLLVKTRHAYEIYQRLGLNCAYVGFTCRDRLVPNVQRETELWLCVIGDSYTNKDVGSVLRVWRRNPQFPQLLICLHDIYEELEPLLVEMPNVTYRREKLADEELRLLQNCSAVHVCPSTMEGWGHSIVESMSVGALLLTMGAPPMDEHVDESRGVLFGYTTRRPRAFGFHHAIDEASLEDAVRRALALSDAERAERGRRAREYFLASDGRFRSAFIAEMKAILKMPPDQPAKDAIQRGDTQEHGLCIPSCR